MEHQFDEDHESSAAERAREERVKRLIIAAVPRCAHCQYRYQLGDLAVIGHREHLWMVTIICGQCQHQGFITVVIQSRRTGRNLPISERQREPSPGDQQQSATTPPVDTDDLLDLHLFLEDFDGDFTTLFSKDNQA